MNNIKLKRIMGKIEEAKEFESETDKISDGYHTFGELYEHRSKLFAFVLNSYPDRAFKSKKHDDGEMFKGYFIAGISTPEGWFTYHFKDEYWELIEVDEWEKAPEWDGHKPSDIVRIFSVLKDTIEEATSLDDVPFKSIPNKEGE